MIHSMTGFGKANLQFIDKKITVEIKSLNSKNIDLNARMPLQYREHELEFRKQIAQALTRGKIDFGLFVESTFEQANSTINVPVVQSYVKQLEKVSDSTLTNESALNIVMRLPEVLKTEREEINEEEFLNIKKLIDEALENLTQYRKEEGSVLEKDFVKRIKNIDQLLEQVIAIDPERIKNVRERLEKGISDIKERVDENRFEQELIYYIEKFDITEEKVRLKNHLEYFLETLASKDSNGKKLGFISQEIGREINTIGSKSNFATMQKLVVQMKDELEKIKEQMLNVL